MAFVSSLDPAEGERYELVALVVGGERHHRQLDLHAELELGRVVFGGLPMSCGLASGQVEISGARAFCMG